MGFKAIFKRDELTRDDVIEPVDAGSLKATVNVMPRPISQSEDMLKQAIADGVAKLKEEEWVWVDGFKGTDKNMMCRDYRFEMNKQFDLPAGVEPSVCSSGFHFCPNLTDVFGYYSIENGNRFFRVRALVRKKDLSPELPAGNSQLDLYTQLMYSMNRKYKLTSKSIIFLSELTPEEILDVYTAKINVDISEWTKEDKLEAIQTSPQSVTRRYRTLKLMDYGYTKLLAEWLVKHGRYDTAKALGSQKELSWDARIIALFETEDD